MIKLGYILRRNHLTVRKNILRNNFLKMKVNLHKKVLVQAEILCSKNEQKLVGLKMHLNKINVSKNKFDFSKLNFFEFSVHCVKPYENMYNFYRLFLKRSTICTLVLGLFFHKKFKKV